MSQRFSGGVIRGVPVVPAGPLQTGAAPGVWTLTEATYWTRQGLWPTAGVFAVEDVFSTWLYTGNSTTQTITNGIDLAGQGGLVWLKRRNAAGVSYLADTARGPGFIVQSSTTTQQQFSASGYVSGFNSNGFQIIAGPNFSAYNETGQTYVSWTFRKAPNFFDVVTWTANDTYPRAIPHSLGIKPGFIVFKLLNGAQDWYAYHQSEGASKFLNLNTTGASVSSTGAWWGVEPTATDFTVGNIPSTAGETYVAYLFAHVPGSNGIIQCGSYTGNGSATGPVVTLGWEPQWLMVKRANGTGNWQMLDNMRGLPVGSADATLQANLSDTETSVDYISPTATGFQVVSTSSQVNTNASTYIYIAIRRGPMRTPTLGTSVFSPNNGLTAGTAYNVGFPNDWAVEKRPDATFSWYSGTRLTGNAAWLNPNLTSAETASTGWNFSGNTNFFSQSIDNPALVYSFRRAPGFFDVVCYTGTGVARTVNHSLGVTPELMIMKNRSSAGYSWFTWDKSADLSQASALLALNNAAGRPAFSSGNLNSTVPTSTVFTVGGDSNASGNNYVAYLFASVPGVSKVGSYTGNGSSQTINCAFTTGARFVMIKRTNAAGDWYVWDSARGIVAGNDPYLALNSTAAEVTSDDSVDTDSTGFVVNQVAASNINVNAATYIFLAIA